MSIGVREKITYFIITVRQDLRLAFIGPALSVGLHEREPTDKKDDQLIPR